jgi:hypothetical protein
MQRNRPERPLVQKVRESWQKRLSIRVDSERDMTGAEIDDVGPPDHSDFATHESNGSKKNLGLESILEQWVDEFEAAMTFLNDELRRIFRSVSEVLPHDLDDKVYFVVDGKHEDLRQLYNSAAMRIRNLVAEEIQIAVERETYPDTVEYIEGIHKQELEYARLAGQVRNLLA